MARGLSGQAQSGVAGEVRYGVCQASASTGREAGVLRDGYARLPNSLFLRDSMQGGLRYCESSIGQGLRQPDWHDTGGAESDRKRTQVGAGSAGEAGVGEPVVSRDAG